MVFPNLYYKRTAATAKACYICYKPTVTVLATIDTSDFFYTCPVHLTDRGFATRAPDLEPEVKKDSDKAVSAEEIARVKQEWEEKQRLKKEKEKEKEKEKKADGGKKDNTDGESKDAGGEKDAAEKAKADGDQQPKTSAEPSTPKSSSLSSEPSSRPTHERYVLHRDIFALRTADHRRRRQTAQAKDLAPRLPGAPRSSLSHLSNGG